MFHFVVTGFDGLSITEARRLTKNTMSSWLKCFVTFVTFVAFVTFVSS